MSMYVNKHCTALCLSSCWLYWIVCTVNAGSGCRPYLCFLTSKCETPSSSRGFLWLNKWSVVSPGNTGNRETVHHQINFATETHVERPGDSSPPDGVYWPGSCQFWFFWRRGKSFTIRSQSNTTHLLQIMGTRVRISSMRLLSLSLRIFSALLRNSREELYFGGSSGNFGFLTFFVVISDLEDILK